MEHDHQHPLLEYAKTYPRFTGDLSPRGCRYDVVVGAWVIEETGELYVQTDSRQRLMTKKADVETGEDQKRE